MAVTFEDADPAVGAIARELIVKHHEHLAGEDVRYVFRSEHAKDAGKAVLGKARKISGLNAFLTTGEDDSDYFVIELAADIWAGLGAKERRALLDHELSHCRIKYAGDTGEPTLYIAPHDLEEFNDVVERHGLWRRDVKEFLDAASGQLRLLADAEDVA